MDTPKAKIIIYRKWWFWTIVVLLLFIIAGSLRNSYSKRESPQSAKAIDSVTSIY